MLFKRKIRNYRIVHNENKFSLADEVRTWINEGWKLQDGISISHGLTEGHQGGFKSDCIHYAQAMIKL